MKEFFANIKVEFKKITWPTDKEMKEGTAQVFVFMVVLALFFAGVDALISTGVAAATGDDNVPIVEEWYEEDAFDFDDDLEDDVENNHEDDDVEIEDEA